MAKGTIVAQYAEAFRRGYLGEEAKVEGVLGRIIRGKRAEDFETLTDDSTRRLILLTDPLALRAMIGVPAFDLLLRVGWDHPYAVSKIRDGYKVKLVVFAEGGNALLCTWDNMIHLVGKAYPEIDQKLRRWLPELKKLDFKKFDQIELAYGCDMSSIDHDGPSNPQYMTVERYKTAADTLVNARAFLYFAIHLRELFAGDGSTRDSLGNVGVKEYMALNCPISELKDAELIDLEPELPAADRLTFKKRAPGPRIGFPSFYNPDDVGKRYKPRWDWVEEDAKWANLRPVSQDRGIKRLLVGIDEQDSFIMPEIRLANGSVIQQAGELLVPGAVDDLRRFIELIYMYPEEFSGVLFSMDMHIPWQIFFSTWWRKRDRSMIDPMTYLTYEAVERGDYYPALETSWSLGYLKQLGAMMIWRDHCMIGTPGCALMPALAEAIKWLAVARHIQPEYMPKGTIPQTEHYGIFCPCVEVPKPGGTLNTIMLDRIASYDEIVAAGEAEDFCVKESMKQAIKYFGAKHPDALAKLRFLRDCTSMVFPQNRIEADNFLQSMEDDGVIITESTKLFKH
ncbi:MAG: hypothetical protein WC517_02860 [Patescibacteria group bacterium]